MNNHFQVFPCLFIGISLFLLMIGIRVITTKRPFLLSSRSVLMVWIVVFLYQSVDLYLTVKGHGALNQSNYTRLMPLLCIFCMLAFYWYRVSYTVIGVSDESFRAALRYSLKKHQIEFIEQQSVVILASEMRILSLRFNHGACGK